MSTSQRTSTVPAKWPISQWCLLWGSQQTNVARQNVQFKNVTPDGACSYQSHLNDRSGIFRVVYFFFAFTKLRKATTSLVTSVRPPAWKNSAPHWTDSHEIWYWSIFRKSVKKNQVSLQSDQNKGYFTWRPTAQKITDKIKTYIFCYIFPKIVPFMRQCGKML